MNRQIANTTAWSLSICSCVEVDGSCFPELWMNLRFDQRVQFWATKIPKCCTVEHVTKQVMKTLFIPVYLKVWLRSCLTCRWSTLDRDPTTARYQLIPLSCSPSAKLFQRTLKLCSWDMIFTSVSPSSSRRRLFSSTQTASTFPIRLLWTCISNKVAACGQTVNRMVEKHHLKLLI